MTHESPRETASKHLLVTPARHQAMRMKAAELGLSLVELTEQCLAKGLAELGTPEKTSSREFYATMEKMIPTISRKNDLPPLPSLEEEDEEDTPPGKSLWE